jgi:hypothetical protein
MGGNRLLSTNGSRPVFYRIRNKRMTIRCESLYGDK